LLALLAVSIFATHTFSGFYLDATADALHAHAKLIDHALSAEPSADVDPRIKELGRLADVRVTVMLADGRVIADSDESPAVMDNHATRPEMAAALGGKLGRSVRVSDTLERRMMYVAVPRSGSDGRVGAVIRTAVPITAIDDVLASIYVKTAAAGIGIAALAALVIWLVSRRVAQPLEQLASAAQRFSAGDFHEISTSGSAEIVRVADAMNRMAKDLDERIRTIVRQRNEQDAVLSSMTEGVLAVDGAEAVIAINQTAARLLGTTVARASGRSIQEVTREAELHRAIASVVSHDSPTECDCVLRTPEPRHIQLHGAPLLDGHGRRTGSVVVLNDVTRLRRLESLRRDFVANVSHELKTPITSIKGFLETLLSGRVQSAEDTKRFLEIALRQADRLSAIIDDLLSLSRLEQEGEQGGLPRQSERVYDVLAGAVEVCRPKAEEKGVTLALQCDSGLRAEMNAPLVEQAVVNLIDNAIKYSERGAAIDISAAAAPNRLELRISDHGCGIESHHLPRLFERFYRADKARSRRLGGTGLGLAIVKHIATAHGGSVRVESTPGKGTAFTISLPFDTPRALVAGTA
jgi:two-component system phosphate regulon sensor histidine kinase PhoR